MTPARLIASVLLLLAVYAVLTVGWPVMLALAQTNAYYPIAIGLWTLAALLILAVHITDRLEAHRG